MKATEVLIVGGGLSGLALAERLGSQSRSFRLLEGRDRLGGRVLSHRSRGQGYDLGPAWFWPGQSRMAALVDTLNLRVFQQHATGRMVFQDGTGAITRHIEMATMAGSLRIDGGLGRIIVGLSSAIVPDQVHLGHRVTQIAQRTDALIATFETATGSDEIEAQHVVLALPPRLAAASIRFDPTLPDQTAEAMRNVPTWMAGHAKILAIYDTPFWRNIGLNGDAMSHVGPLAEVHDACPMDALHGALFGFVSTPPEGRSDAEAFKAKALQHLVDLFGSDAAAPTELILKDWALDPFTAAADDATPLAGHPAYGLPPALDDLWHNRLHFGSTETGQTFGGFLEGALEAADRIATAI
ncbi:MAG: NAD(P)/FAD-dependent oxidoreductase [Pseudomonadota bacterium]